MLGRGQALEWYELDRQHEELNKIAIKKLNRINRLQKKHKFKTYIETGKGGSGRRRALRGGQPSLVAQS